MTIDAPLRKREAAEAAASGNRRPLTGLLKQLDVQIVILVGAILVLMVFFATQSHAFFSPSNFLSILNQNSATFVVAAAAGLLLMAGYVDMSVGSVMALAGVSAGLAFISSGLAVGIVVGVLVGLAVGLANAVLIGILELSPIVVTLGGLAAARGLAQVLAPGSLYGFPASVTQAGSGQFLGLSFLIWTAIVICALALFVSAKLPVGKHIIAVGVNRRAAFLTGIPVKRIVFLLYAFVGGAVGIAGILQVMRLGSAPSGTLGVGFETAILTAVLLGGIPFTGGRGSVLGVLLGVWLIAVLNNGLTLMNVPPETSGIITGVVLVLAAASSIRGVRIRRRK